MPTYNVSHEADDGISREVMRKMRSSRHALVSVADPRDYKAVCGKLTAMLGGRMHPTIFAAAMGVPVVGLSYNRKFRGFFRLLGAEHRVMQVEDFVNRRRTGDLVEMLSADIKGWSEPPAGVDALVRMTRDYTALVLTRSLRGRTLRARRVRPKELQGS
jgi:hypothetical protein